MRLGKQVATLGTRDGGGRPRPLWKCAFGGHAALASQLRPCEATETPVTTVCAWCCREGHAASSGETGAIVGLCEDHINRFCAEVDAALGGREPGRTAAPAGLPPVRAPRREAHAVDDRVVRRVVDVLVTNVRLDLCDACIAAEVACAVAVATAAADRLAASADFLRDQWRCGRCGNRTMVTRARSRVVRTRGAA